jgi:ribosome-binding factor A
MESVLQRKVAKLIQVEVSTILQRETQYSMGTMATISVVRVTRDLELGKIYVSIFPETNAQEVVKNLNKNVWEIRKFLAARIKNQMRKMPNIQFFWDNTLQEAEKIDQLFSTIVIPEETEEEEEE